MDYLSHTAFLLHVLSDHGPDLALAQQPPARGHLEALVGPVLLQDSPNDPDGLWHTESANISTNTSLLTNTA